MSASLPALYLASASPRRGELLTQIGVSYERLAIAFDETRGDAEAAADYAMRLALGKAQAGYQRVAAGAPKRPVLGADTIVVLGGDILAKPADLTEAKAMLARLAGRWHEVLTAVAVVGEAPATNEELIVTAMNQTRVHMRALSAAEITAYVHREHVLDKAGAYAVQGLAGAFIDRIEGSYSAVMGLPLCETSQLLQRFGINVLTCQQNNKSYE